MATLSGNDGAVTVGSTNLAAVRNWSVEISADTIETTVMGQETRSYVRGLSSFSGSADIYFDASEFDGAEATFNPTNASNAVGDSPIAVKLYVKQDATNDQVFTGNIVVTGYTVNSSFDGMVEASISFQGSGGATFSATGNV